MSENLIGPLNKVDSKMDRAEMAKLLEKMGVKMRYLGGYRFDDYEPGDTPVGTTYFTFSGESIKLGMNYVEQIIFDGILNNKTKDHFVMTKVPEMDGKATLDVFPCTDEKLALILSQNKNWCYESTVKLLEIIVQLNKDGFACALEVGTNWSSKKGKNLYFKLNAAEIEMVLTQDEINNMFCDYDINEQVVIRRMPHQLLTTGFDDLDSRHDIYSKAYNVVTEQRGRHKDSGNVFDALITPQNFDNLNDLVNAFYSAIVIKSVPLKEALTFQERLSTNKVLELKENKL